MNMISRFFMKPAELNKPEDFLREDLLSEAFKAQKVAVKSDGTGVAFVTDNWVVLADTKIVNGVKIVEFDFISRTARSLRYAFFMNASSVKSLGDLLRTLPRFDYNDIFNVSFKWR